MDKKFIAGGALVGLVLAGGISTLSAQTVATETGLTEAQVIAIALAEVPGEVQEIELERARGMQVYEVDVLAADGTEMEIKVAAETGEILKVGADGACGGKRGRHGDDA